MLGKKKANKDDDLPEFEQGETADAKIQEQTTQNVLDFVANEFKNHYAGVFDPKSIEDGKINTEAMTLDLLFGIFAELRLLRLHQTKK